MRSGRLREEDEREDRAWEMTQRDDDGPRDFARSWYAQAKYRIEFTWLSILFKIDSR